MSSAVILLAFAGSAPAEATTKTKPPSVGACAGTDMLTEFSATDPDRYRRLREQADAAKNADAVLWKVARPGTKPSYLFGTVHLTDPRVTAIPPPVQQAFEGSDVLALEVADLSPNAMARALLSAVNAALYTDGRSLETQLNSEDFAKVKRKLKSAGMPVATAKVFKPWVVTMMLASSDCERKRAKSGKRILDMQLAERAKTDGKVVVGLEQIEEQLQTLAATPHDDQIAMLKAGLAYLDRTDDLIETLIQIYLKREIGATWPFQLMLAEKAGISPRAFDAFRSNLVEKRNLRMRDTALPLIEKGGAFVAVGALHLPGDRGLVALIRKAGFDVTPVY